MNGILDGDVVLSRLTREQAAKLKEQVQAENDAVCTQYLASPLDLTLMWSQSAPGDAWPMSGRLTM